ncbi:RipA family octameric membrane protein [Leeuwenhoekiella palythoae]|uniref:RipA family octameric membrane protein n=1 Tax=Leeuwenhoekiella palythoae TaxID=573501 RepID=UPI00351354A2
MKKETKYSKNNSSDQDKISVLDIHRTYWQCRDFELNSLWQRSIFFTAFIVLVFSAYGGVLSKVLELNVNNITFLISNSIAYFISCLGIVFSVLWVKMAKGSKAWYEVYESAIVCLERDKRYTTKLARKIGGFQQNRLKNYGGVNINNKILSTTAGAYSVSKINIAIGQVFFITWTLLSMVHIVIISVILINQPLFQCSCMFSILIAIIIYITIYYRVVKANRFSSSSIPDFARANS